MLENERNKLDDIAGVLAEMASRLSLQAAIKRKRDKEFEELKQYLAERSPSMCRGPSLHRGEKRCCAEEGESPLADDGATFELARAIGQIEGRFMEIMDDDLFKLSEDEIQELTHEELFEKIQAHYARLRGVGERFADL